MGMYVDYTSYPYFTMLDYRGNIAAFRSLDHFLIGDLSSSMFVSCIPLDGSCINILILGKPQAGDSL